MFKKKKEVYEGADNAITKTARYAASSRFRGVVCILLLLALIPSAWLNIMLSQKKEIVVGITQEGRPQVMSQTPAQLSMNVFITDFIQKFLNYSPNTVKENMSYATRFVTPNFEAAFKHVLGQEFIDSVIRNGTTQMTTVSLDGITINSLQEGSLAAEIRANRIRSDKFVKETVESTITINMLLVQGEITPDNPWGWYVDRINESMTSQR